MRGRRAKVFELADIAGFGGWSLSGNGALADVLGESDLVWIPGSKVARDFVRSLLG